MALLGHDFAMLRELRRVIPLSCTLEDLHPRSYSSAVASELDLLRTKPRGLYAACETVKKRWICDAVELQNRGTFELYALEASS